MTREDTEPREATLVYLDASAFVKLVVSEPESEALIAALRERPRRVSSALLAAEAVRAALRVSEPDAAQAERLLDDVALIPVTEELLEVASRIEPPSLRSLDAIHLATAKSLDDELEVLLSYDERLLAAAADAGIATESPGWTDSPSAPADLR